MAEDRMAMLETLRKAVAGGDVDSLREGVRLLARAAILVPRPGRRAVGLCGCTHQVHNRFGRGGVPFADAVPADLNAGTQGGRDGHVQDPDN
jgi:hypothetical protein